MLSILISIYFLADLIVKLPIFVYWVEINKNLSTNVLLYMQRKVEIRVFFLSFFSFNNSAVTV